MRVNVAALDYVGRIGSGRRNCTVAEATEIVEKYAVISVEKDSLSSLLVVFQLAENKRRDVAVSVNFGDPLIVNASVLERFNTFLA